MRRRREYGSCGFAMIVGFAVVVGVVVSVHSPHVRVGTSRLMGDMAQGRRVVDGDMYLCSDAQPERKENARYEDTQPHGRSIYRSAAPWQEPWSITSKPIVKSHPQSPLFTRLWRSRLDSRVGFSAYLRQDPPEYLWTNSS